jgi:hypothetical protein
MAAISKARLVCIFSILSPPAAQPSHDNGCPPRRFLRHPVVSSRNATFIDFG